MLFPLFALVALANFAVTAPTNDAVTLMTDDLDMLNSIMDISDFLDGWGDSGFLLKGVYFHGVDDQSEQSPSGSNYTQIQYREPADLYSRAPSCNSPSCLVSDTGYKLFSQAQEEFIAGKFCPYVAKTAYPVGTGTIAYLFTRAVCNGNVACDLIVTWVGVGAGTAAGDWKALANECQAALTSIEHGCGYYGGSEACTSGRGKATYQIGAASTTTTCPSTKCQTATCSSSNSNCQAYSTKRRAMM